MSKNKKKKNKFCDPAVCDHCMYIGEGDFICDMEEEPVLVVESWEPTDAYMMCEAKPNG